MTVLACILGGAAACDLTWAFVMPYKKHKFCDGRGYDPYCNYTGKVLRFGARWVRPGLRRK